MQSAADEAAARARERMSMGDTQTRTAPNTRIYQELPAYVAEVVDHVRSARAITPQEYLRRVSERPDETRENLQQNLTDFYIVTKSHQRAREVLTRGTLLIPLIIRDASCQKKTFEEFLLHLETQDIVEAHFLNDETNPKSKFAIPSKKQGRDMARILRDPTAREINCLNLKIWKENPVPECLLGLFDYNILTHIRDCVDENDTVDSGKASQVLTRDLSNCASFHVLALPGAFSFPHADHHHKPTTMFAENEECEKMWYMYRALTKACYNKWAQEKMLAPDTHPFPILLRQGDVLLQPAGYVHSPYTLSKSLMTGTMYLQIFGDSLVSMLEQSITEHDSDHVTNEEPAQELRESIGVINIPLEYDVAPSIYECTW